MSSLSLSGAGNPDSSILRAGIAAYSILFIVLFGTDLDIFLSVRGLLPISSIILILGSLAVLPFLILLSGRAVLFLDDLSVEIVRCALPILLFTLWISIHALGAGTTVVSTPDTDFTRIFPVLQFAFLVFGIALAVAARMFRVSIRPALASAIAVLGSSVIVETVHPGLLGSAASRSGGIALNANVAAFILNAALACFLDFRRARGMDLVAILFTLVAVLFTLSRSGLAQFALVTVAYFTVYGVRAFSREGRADRFGFLAKMLAVLFVVAGGLAALGALLSSADPELRERIETLTLRGGAVYEDPYRYMLLEHYFRLALEHPFLGFGTAYTTSTAEPGAPLGLGPHNMYLRAWIDHGLVGLGLYVAILLSLLATSVAQRSINGVVLVLVVIEYGFFSHNPFDTKATHLFTGLALAQSFHRPRGG